MLKQFLLFLLVPYMAMAQLSGTITVPGTYSTLNTAIIAINQAGISGSLSLIVAASYTETAPTGGYSLYVGGTISNPLIIKSNSTSTKPLLLAANNGNKTPSSTSQDGIWRLIGCVNVIIDGFALWDNNLSAPQTMEFGFGLFKASSSDGCQNVIIKNCLIHLNNQNNASGNLPACDGSRGIDVVNALSSAHNLSLAITTSSGTHRNNLFVGNQIENCNYGITLMGNSDTPPYLFSDSNNQIGGLNIVESNTIINFGGGGNNPSAGIRTQFQYNLSVINNRLLSNDGNGINHSGSLRGIYINPAPECDLQIMSNTITVKSGGSTSLLNAIDNQAGANGINNNLLISNNLIISCGHYSATSGNFTGIINSASAASLSILGNKFENNSSTAQSGSNYLISNSGAIGKKLQISNNQLTFQFNSTVPYSGLLAEIQVSNLLNTASLSVNSNTFLNVVHFPQPGAGNIQFISNSADVAKFECSANLWLNLNLNHAANEYCIYNASSTGSLLSVSANTVSNFQRQIAGNFYFYYGNSSTPAGATHSITSNFINKIVSPNGVGNFYGIYDAEGNQSPYPVKVILSNTISGVQFSGTGSVEGIYVSDLGDLPSGSTSTISNNLIEDCASGDNVYALYLTSPFPLIVPLAVYDNTIRNLKANNTNASSYGIYYSANNAGVKFFRNRIFNISSSAQTGSVCGVYAANAGTTSFYNNLIANLNAINAVGNNRVNGVYFATGGLVRFYYNTIRLNASSTSLNFGTNALYVSSTPSIELRNNLLLNLSANTGTGLTIAYRRSSNVSTTYSLNSNNNIFYAGTPGPNNLLLYNGSAAYQNMTNLQAGLAPRESLSFTQNQSFQSVNGFAPSFLHLNNSQISFAESGAININQILEDYDNEIRQGNSGYVGTGTAPDMGADEVNTNTNSCTSSAPSTIAVSSNKVCEGDTLVLFSLQPTSGAGLTYQWKFATSISGPYNPVSSGLGATSTEYTTAALAAGQYFFVLETTCSFNSQTSISNAYSVSVNAPPLLSVSSNSLLCEGSTINLLAAGTASQYYWTGPAAFTSTLQSPTILNVSADHAGIYKLEASNGFCSAPSATVAVVVVQINVSVQATPSIICSGIASTLAATGNFSLCIWNGSPGSPSISVFPSQSTIYTLQASGAGTCAMTKTVQVVVVNPTITANTALICLPSNSALATVNAFSPSLVSWYSSNQANFPFYYGPSTPVITNTNVQLFARATLMRDLISNSLLTGSVSTSALMFDLIPLNNVLIKSFDLHLNNASTCTVEIWTKAGSNIGFTNSSTGWTQLGTSTLLANGQGSLSSSGLTFSLPIAAFQSQAFHIIVNGNSLQTTNTGTWTGAQFSLVNPASGSAFNVTNSTFEFEGAINYAAEICSSTLIPVNITVVSPIALNTMATPSVVCPGNSATLSATGAVSYTWSNGITSSSFQVNPQSVKTFTIKGTDSLGCSSQSLLTIYVHSLSPINIVASTTIACPNSPISFTASGGNTYTWSAGPNGAFFTAYPSVNSSYSVFGSNSNNCVSQQSISVTTKSVPTVYVTSTKTLVCKGETVELTANGALTYTWLPGSMNTSTNIVQPIVNSVFNVIGQGLNTCTNVGFAYLQVDICESIKVSIPVAEISIFPNPVDNLLRIRASENILQTYLYDVQGRVCLEQTCNDTDFTVDVGHLSGGLYFVELQMTNSRQFHKIIINKN